MGNDIKIWQNHADNPFAIMLKRFWAALTPKEKREFRESLFEVIGRSADGEHERTDGRTAAEYDEHVIFRFFGILFNEDPNWCQNFEEDKIDFFLDQLGKDLKVIYPGRKKESEKIRKAA